MFKLFAVKNITIAVGAVLLVGILAFVLAVYVFPLSQAVAPSHTESTPSNQNQNTPTAKGVIVSRSNFGDICGERGVALTNATAYKSGEKPYLYTSMLQQEDSSVYPVIQAYNDNAMRQLLANPTSVQLIGCLTRVAEAKTELSCPTAGNTYADVYTAEYRLTVYEAKTRTVVASELITYDAINTCPIMPYPVGRTKIFTPPSSSQLNAIVTPLIN